MAKSIKLKSDNYIDSSSIVHARQPLSTYLSNVEVQTKYKKFDINFDVSNASPGDFVTGHTTNTIPTISGYYVLGFLIIGATYGDANYVVAVNNRNNYVYALLRLGYRGTDTTIDMSGYIVYAKTSLVDNTSLV